MDSQASVLVVSCEYAPFPGGIGTYVGALARVLQACAVEVQVLAPAYPELPPPPPEPGVHRLLARRGLSWRSALSLLRLLADARPGQLLLAADIRSVLLLHLLKPLHRQSYRAMVHGHEAGKFRRGSLMSRLANRAYLGAERVLYNSEATRDLFHRRLGRPEREAVSLLGVEGHWFEPAEGDFEHPALAALPAHVPVVCSVGHVAPRKGQLETVRALALARETCGLGEVVYVVAGWPNDSVYATRVQAEAERLSLPLLMTGELSQADLKRLFRRAHCHCLLAQPVRGKIEGFGLVLLEAAAQACPSVATRVGGIPEVLGESAWLVELGDRHAAAQALAAVLQQAEARQRAARLALARAQRFSWAACAAVTFPELDLTLASESLRPGLLLQPG